MIGLSQNRSRHCLEVARLMYEMAVERGWEINRCQEMFILGYVHDIGYEFCSNQQEHSNVGADLLQKQGYKYWREVKYHGVPTDEYSSEELQLLNVADMTIDSSGERVGIKKRLADIQERYGNNSKQYNNAVKLSYKIGLI